MFVASRSVSLIKVIGLVNILMKALPAGSEVHLRKPRNSEANLFERVSAQIARMEGLDVVWWEPEPGGRAMVYLRDYDMVEASDRVYAFFSEEAQQGGGTGHVVDASLVRGIPVKAYLVGSRRDPILIGDWDTQDG